VDFVFYTPKTAKETAYALHYTQRSKDTDYGGKAARARGRCASQGLKSTAARKKPSTTRANGAS